eukprot:53548_2
MAKDVGVLRAKAVARVREWLLAKINLLKKPGTNIQIIQRDVLLKYRPHTLLYCTIEHYRTDNCRGSHCPLHRRREFAGRKLADNTVHAACWVPRPPSSWFVNWGGARYRAFYAFLAESGSEEVAEEVV